MTEQTLDRTALPSIAPKIGFVSLGCPKALTDSELILTQLRAEGYDTSKTFAGADLVIVNTCGFIDDAVKESLDTIGEALAENGKVIVTGCLGAKTGEGGSNLVRSMRPSVLAVTGPHATNEVMDAVHLHVPKPHDPFVDLVPAQGVKLTPRHYAYLKISEGCNHRCSFCIIPSMRGDLASRPIGDVLGEAHEGAGHRREKPRPPATLARGVPADRRSKHVHRRFPWRDGSRVRAPARFHARGPNRSGRVLCLFAGGGCDSE